MPNWHLFRAANSETNMKPNLNLKTHSIAKSGIAMAILALGASVGLAQTAEKRMKAKDMPMKDGMPMNAHGSMTKMDPAVVKQLTSSWPEVSQKAAMDMVEKYGAPQGATATMLVWEKNGPWKRTIVYSEPVQHDFPMPHKDVMQQFIDYKVPTDKFDELAEFDGSVVVNRTNGEISARCDKEAANFLAINLADEVVTGKRSVKEAREEYAKQIMAKMANQPAPLTEKLMVLSPTGDTAFSDMPADAMKKKKSK